MTPTIYRIGIDPGVHTGFALTVNSKLVRVTSMTAVECEQAVLELWNAPTSVDEPKAIHVYVEDTRNLRLPRAQQNKFREKGVGSVHRDMGRWQEFLTFHSIPHTMTGLSPKPFREGNDAWFRRVTGWTLRTNEHGRAAAGLIWGR